jgi:hypothetical protein
MNVVITSCFDAYIDTYISYKINNLAQWEAMVSTDVIFYEDVRCSKSQYFASVVKEREDFFVPYTNSKTQEESNSEEDEVILGVDMPSPTLDHKKLRFLTQTLQEAWKHIRSLESLVRVSITPRRYARNVVLVSSIHMPSSFLKEDKYDTLMEDDTNIDSRFEINGNIVEYYGKVVRFSWDEGVDLIQVV